MSLRTSIFNSIHDIPFAQWNALVSNRSCSYSHEFWEILEASGLNDFDFSHVLFYNDDNLPVAVASFYGITTDVAIFAPEKLKQILEKIRRVFPGFLKLRMLECGTPITLNSPFVSAHESYVQEVSRTLGGLLRTIARNNGQHIIVVRDFEPGSDSIQTGFKELGYHIVDSLPNTYMDLSWGSYEEFSFCLKSYYRSKLKRHLRINEKQCVSHELRTDFHDLAGVLSEQWLVVHRQADEFQREVLSEAFYRDFSLKLGERSKVLLFYRERELVGHALLLHDGEILRWLYFGRKKAGNDSLYIYVANAVMETAINLGAKRLELGLTTYSIKRDLGAYMSPIKIAIRSPWLFINPFVGKVYLLLNKPPAISNKDVFKQDC